jgi:hypothetical protein
MKYLFLRGNLTKNNDDSVSVALGDKRPSYFTVKSWVPRFTTEHLSTEDEDCPGTPTKVTVPENRCHSLHDPG